ncbi:unnamed protein product [Closterium sp. NIES-54]
MEGSSVRLGAMKNGLGRWSAVLCDSRGAPRPLDLSAPATAATAKTATAGATAATATAATATAATATAAAAAPLLLLLLRLLLLLPSLSQPLPPRTPPSLPAMTSLRRSGGSGDGGGGSNGSGGGRPSSRCGAVQWGVSGGGQMRVQQRQHEALTPQHLREWYTSRGGGGYSSGGRSAVVQLGVTGGGLQQLQRRPHETLSPQQLREWYVQRGASRGSARCPYVIRTGDRAGQTCGTVGHTLSRCFSYLSDTWRIEFGNATELPRWLELVRQGVEIFTLDFDAILTGMYALSASAEGDCSRCVPPDPGIAAAALGASEFGTLPGTAPAQAVHTFTLDSGASRCFFRDSTTLTPLSAPVPVRLADPSGGPVVARSSTVLPCPMVLSGSLSGLHLPSFSTNLVSTATLQDAMVTTTTPGGQRVLICTCTRTGRHQATFTRRPGSSLYTLATEPPQVAASAQVSASGQVAASCSCRLLLHQTLLKHHRLGHPSLPRHRGMHSCLLVSSLPRSLPPLPPSPAPPCPPCVEGRQRAAPHSSSFPPTTAPLQTLHMDVWGPARVSGQGREQYFLLVVDDYTRYTTVFPLRSKGEVVYVLIPWIRTVHFQLRERFGHDLPDLRLHSDRGGEFSSDLLRDFFRGKGILKSFMLPNSPHQNGNAERRIGLVMEVARTSMIHAAAPHFLWPFAVRYAAHQLNLLPRVSLPETSPTLRWMGEVGDASVFRVWGSRAFVRDPSADKLSARSIPCIFLGFVPNAPGRQFYHPTSRHVLRTSQDVDPLPGTVPVEVAISSGAARDGVSGDAASRGAELGDAGSDVSGSEGAEPGGEEPRGAEPVGVEQSGAESEGAESGGAEPQGAASSGGLAGASPRLSLQPLREWLVQRTRLRSGAPGAGGAGDVGAGGDGVSAGAGGTGGTVAAGPGGAHTKDPTEPGAARAGGSCASGAGAGGAGAEGTGVGGTGTGGAEAAGAGAVDPGAGVPSSPGLTPPLLCPPPDQLQLPLQPASPLPAPSPYTEQSSGLTECREAASLPVSPVRTAHRIPRSRPPPVPGTHAMALRPSSIPLRVPLPAPPESSFLEVTNPESNRARATSPTISCLLATTITNPSFNSGAASALVAELLDFAAACRLDYATTLVVWYASASPPSVGGECALGTDVLEDRQEDFECLSAAVPRFTSMLLAPEGDPDAPNIPTPRSYTEAITGPYSSQWQAAMDAEMASWKSTGTYVDEFPPPGANVVDGMWIFKGVDFFQTFSPTPKMTTLRVLLHVAAQRDYELHSLDFSTAFLQGSLHEEIWLRRPPGFTGSFPAGTQWSLRRPFYGLHQAPREWHDTLRTTLAALGFAHGTADPSLFLRTNTSLPPFYVLVYVDDLVFATGDTEALTLVLQHFGFQFSSPQPTPLSTSHSLSAPPSDESVEPSGPYPELVGCLMYLMTCTRPDLAYPLSLLARYVAPDRQRKVQWDAAKRVLNYLCITSGMGLVLGGRGPVVLTGHADASWAEIYAGAMAARELRWLTYLLTDLGEQSRSPPVLYVDNKAMISLCQEHRLEHRMKHIALRYFLARELQQGGQLRLAYLTTRSNTADIFTKALLPSDHQRFSTVLDLVPTLPHLLTA